MLLVDVGAAVVLLRRALVPPRLGVLAGHADEKPRFPPLSEVGRARLGAAEQRPDADKLIVRDRARGVAEWSDSIALRPDFLTIRTRHHRSPRGRGTARASP
jgi:hypothetical protein